MNNGDSTPKDAHNNETFNMLSKMIEDRYNGDNIELIQRITAETIIGMVPAANALLSKTC